MTGDIPIYVINLDRSPERLAHATGILAAQGLAFHRLPAIDGRRLSETDVAGVFDAERSRRTYHVPMQKGEIACFLSHRLAWKTFLDESAAPFAVIFEDDLALQGSLAPVLDALAAGPFPPWDIIKLWGREHSLSRSVAPLAGGFRLTREAVAPKRTVGQIVSRAGAKTLLARTLPIHRPIDVQLQYAWELGIKLLTIAPSLVVDRGEELFGASSTKATVSRFDLAKIKREARRTILQADLRARSFGRFVRAT